MKTVRKMVDIFGRFLFLLFILIGTFVFAMFQGGMVSWTIFYIISPFVIYSILLFLYPLSGMTVERVIRTPHVQNGEKLIVSLTVKRKDRFPLLYTVVAEKWAEREITVLAGDSLKRLFLFGFSKEVQWEYEVEQMPRGEHVLQGVTVDIVDFFGWLRKKKFIEAKDTILVFPKTTDIHYVPFDTQYDQGTMVSPLNIVKDTTMATGVRNYQAGDRVTWIHWKSFARTQTLMTKEFEDRRSQELLLLLDGRETDVFEELVELTASILMEVSEHQADLAMMTTGPERSLFPYIQSEEQLHRALVHLAKIKSTASADIPVDLGTEFRQGGSIVVITGNPDWPFLQSVLLNAKGAGSIICFTVVKRDNPILKTVEDTIQLTRSKGITVHVLEREQFSDAFKGVGRV
ncbi:DUF58 domain-containing protein [Sporosarcina sp. JAI121]|uniref:DUF58 domain-containing protein n=1 Tax=Sporosarcina sp. JAI121 TaxID=2723064 RepID=UPI0015C76A7E|nr:DUF58 domain-containing protein [Sporosarcina sp. JAI121]NYF26329.1 uncharacterized protein (DUF58 family) [Sporosarcina sp. JAI121]